MEHLIEFIYRLLRFLPRFKAINPDEGAVIIRFGRYVKTLYGGRYRFYWPVVTEIKIAKTSSQPIDLPTQTITTQNDETHVINGSIIYRVVDLKIALLENVDAESNLQEAALNAFRLAVSASTALDCEDIIEDVTCDLSDSEVLYGIEVITVNVAEWAKVIPIRNISD